jgi:hypothetical protein
MAGPLNCSRTGGPQWDHRIQQRQRHRGPHSAQKVMATEQPALGNEIAHGNFSGWESEAGSNR